MKQNSFQIISNVLEARHSHPRAKKLRAAIQSLKQQAGQETDVKKKRELLWKIKRLRSNLSLLPSTGYDVHRSYAAY